ncbi:MAG: division/cell wall cluster transcriptional repressor MraZ [Candidatus Levybacteria bacterium]|nr:division/cell wall cluster transcriptional repressor MraZ [Candidatus Levybacteria bacterium]
MLIGQAEGKLSIKFQTAFPKRFRDEMGDQLIITKGIDQCLLVVSIKNWETLLEGTKDMPFIDKATRELQRYLFGSAELVKLDAQGRFFMPEHVRLYAKMTRDIIFIGVQRYVEIWDRSIWHDHQESIAGSVELLTINLSKTKGHE